MRGSQGWARPQAFPPTLRGRRRFGGTSFLCFRRLTLVPIQTKMVDPDLMRPEEVEWLDAYHTEVTSHRPAETGLGPGPGLLGTGQSCNLPSTCSCQVSVPRGHGHAQPLVNPLPPYGCKYPSAQVWEAVSPRLSGHARALQWLRANTRPLAEQVAARGVAPAVVAAQ